MFSLAPNILAAAGLDVNAPIGVLFNRYKNQIWLTGALKIEIDKMQPLIQRVRMKLSVKKLGNGLQGLYVGPNVSPAIREMMRKRGRKLPPPRFIGVLLKNQYLLTLSRTMRRGIPAPQQQVDFLTKLAAQDTNPLQTALNASMNARLKEQWKRKELDLFGASSLPTASPIGMAVPRAVRKLLKSGNIALSLANGIGVQLQTQWTDEGDIILSLFKPILPSLSIRKLSPANTGWFGSFHINTSAILNIYGWLKQNALKPKTIRQIEKGWNEAYKEAKKVGFDLVTLFNSLSGQWASGYLWTNDMPERVAKAMRRIKTKDGLKGMYVMLGFRQPGQAQSLVRQLYDNRAKMFAKDKNPPKLQILQQGKDTVLQVTMRETAPVYLVAHNTGLWIFGDKSTHLAFDKVWNKKAPSLATRLTKSSPIYESFLKNRRNSFVVFPYVLRQLASWFAPKRAEKWVTPFLQRTRVAASHNSVYPNLQESVLSWELSRKPLVSKKEAAQLKKSTEQFKKAMKAKYPNPKGSSQDIMAGVGLSMTSSFLSSTPLVGVLAAVAIPAFLKYIRRSKTTEARMNLFQLRTRALAYYSKPRTGKNGKALPAEFPCSNMGWVCSPTAKPCSNNATRYKPNPKNWQHACWKQLGFSLKQGHYYRYCFRAAGKGESASFTIRAQGDLDCDGKLSLYEVQGYIANGKPIVTPIRTQRSLE